MVSDRPPLSTIGLFAGIGGIELGLSKAGFHPQMFCESSEEACAVLSRRFQGVPISRDIRNLISRSSYRMPDADVIAAGFPCQDLSQCGRTKGISGAQSGLVDCLIELIARRKRGPKWLVIENVPFMLRLERGRAMLHLTRALEKLGFTWAYRVVDARAFGLPQRRERVILIASRTENPRDVLFADEVGPRGELFELDDRPRGFYWTEGNRGLGWAVDSVPTLKAGSSIGIPSPPAIWLPAYDLIVTPTIEDAEAMQGLPRGWTSLAHVSPKVPSRLRWRLVGNAVPVPVAEWIGNRLYEPGDSSDFNYRMLRFNDKWPQAAWGNSSGRWAVDISKWPYQRSWHALSARYGMRGEQLVNRPRLSLRAAKGFCSRIKRSTLRTDERFVPSLEQYVINCDCGED